MIMNGRRLLMWVTLSAVGMMTACATTRVRPSPAGARNPDSAPERKAALLDQNTEAKAAAAEERFGTEGDRERRQAEREEKAKNEKRVEVVDDAKSPPKK